MNRIKIACELGNIEIEIYPERAPVTCDNFIAYMELGMLSQTSFFRVLRKDNQPDSEYKVESVQGGPKYDPVKGYEPKKGLGPIKHESTKETGIKHVDGTISMCRFAPGETYGGFGFCIGDQPELDFGGRRIPDGQGAAAFGIVVSGRDTVQKIFESTKGHEFLKNEIKINSVSYSP